MHECGRSFSNSITAKREPEPVMPTDGIRSIIAHIDFLNVLSKLTNYIIFIVTNSIDQ